MRFAESNSPVAKSHLVVPFHLLHGVSGWPLSVAAFCIPARWHAVVQNYADNNFLTSRQDRSSFELGRSTMLCFFLESGERDKLFVLK